jgi:serine protease Do
MAATGGAVKALVLAALTLILSCGSTSLAQNRELKDATPLAQPDSSIASQSFDSAEIVKKLAPAFVLIKGTTEHGDVLGTGFIISSDGKIATNLHVIRDLRNGGVQLASGDKFGLLSVQAFDERKDIAIIKIPGFDLPMVTLGNSNNVQVGEPVMIVGSDLPPEI